MAVVKVQQAQRDEAGESLDCHVGSKLRLFVKFLTQGFVIDSVDQKIQLRAP